MSKKKTVISYSGGMDSTTLLFKLIANGDEVFTLNFSYGSKHNATESKHARVICRELSVPYQEIELSFVEKLFSSALLKGGKDIPKAAYDKETMSQTVVPGRNGIFLSILAGYAESIGAERIALANHAGDHFIYPDCRPEWIAAISLSVYLGSDQKVRVYTPFTHLSKGEVCRLAQALKVPLEKTWSCYEGGDMHCGECGTCLERKKAFAEAGLGDPTTYLV